MSKTNAILNTRVSKMESNVSDFTGQKIVQYPVEKELFERLLSVVREYGGDMSLVAGLGVLELVKKDLIDGVEGGDE